VEQYYQPCQVTAGRVDKLPGLDPAAWSHAPTVETVPEMMQIEGAFRPRPPPDAEKTTVALLYDRENLGFFFPLL